MDPKEFTAEFFSNLQGRTFEIRSESGGSIRLELAEVSEPQRSGPAEFYSVTFHGDPEIRLEQGTYTLTGDGSEEFEMFLVPIPPAASGRRRYESVFSRMLDS